MNGKKEKANKPELNILDAISADGGLVILKRLARENASLLKKIERVALKYLKEIVVEEADYEVFFELDTLRVEDVWDQSGPARYRYIDPNEKA